MILPHKGRRRDKSFSGPPPPQGSKDFAKFCNILLPCSSPLFESQVCCCSKINRKKIEFLFLSRIFISFPLELHSRRMTSLFFPLSRSEGVGREKKEVSRPFVWLEEGRRGEEGEDMMHLMHTSIFRKQPVPPPPRKDKLSPLNAV